MFCLATKLRFNSGYQNSQNNGYWYAYSALPTHKVSLHDFGRRPSTKNDNESCRLPLPERRDTQSWLKSFDSQTWRNTHSTVYDQLDDKKACPHLVPKELQTTTESSPYGTLNAFEALRRSMGNSSCSLLLCGMKHGLIIQHSRQKKSPPPAKIFKGTPLVRNILTTAFRDHKGVLLEYFLARDDTVKSDCGTSERSLDAINHKRPGPLIQNITTSQDNAMSHNTNGTCGWLWRSALRLGNYELTSL